MATPRHFKYVLIVLVYSWTVLDAYAQKDSMVVVEDLSLRLVQLDNAEEFVFSAEISESGVVGFYLAETEKFDRLVISDLVPFSVWIEGKLVAPNRQFFEIERQGIFDLEKSDTVFVSLVSSTRFRELKAALLSLESQLFSLKNLPSERHQHHFQEWMILSLLILILGAGVIKVFLPGLFGLLFKIKLGSGRDTLSEEFGFESILGSIYVSLMVAFVYQLATLMDADEEVISNWYLFWDWIRIASFVFVGMLIKYTLLAIFSWLNAIQSIVNLQFHEFVKFFSISSLLLLTFVGMHYWLRYYSDFDITGLVTNVWLIVYLIFMIYLFTKLDNWTHCKKLHIISYLCTTEFIGAFLIALIIYK